MDSKNNNIDIKNIKTERLSPVEINTNDTRKISNNDMSLYSKCTVCDDVADGYHFSALSCAACSAFFRRSIADQKTYACVSRNCNVSINSRKHGVICRYCRFQKCILAGMAPDEVQGKRVKLNPESPLDNSPSSTISASSSSFQPPSIRKIKSKNSNTKSAQNIPLLSEISNVKRIIGQNRISNLQANNYSRSSMLEREYNVYQKFLTSINHLSKIINPNENWRNSLQSKNCFLTWVIFESVQATLRFGGIQTNRIYFGDMTSVDIDQSSLSAYFSDGNTRDAANLARFAQPALQFFAANLCRSVQNMRLDEKEYASLITLLLLHQIKSIQSDQLKQQIFKELGEHYRTCDIDASIKMANIILILSTFDETLSKANEFLCCWNLFS